MRDKKRTRPDVAASEREAEAGTYEGPTTSTTEHTITRPLRQAVHIADFLSRGPENGVTLRHLEKLTSLDNRTIRRQIERERRAGALIISDNRNGYYLTDDPAEAQRFAQSMLHRSREIAKTARAIERAVRLID